MAQQTLQITSIANGQAPQQYFGGDGSYQFGVGIDPDYSLSGSVYKKSGALIPVRYEKFSGSFIQDTPLFLLNNPKNTLIYAITADSHIVSYTNALASETEISALGSLTGNGGAYYNNYIYRALGTDIGRYGPLDGAPAVNNTFWTGTLAKTALNNKAYPSIHSVSIPNHPMHVHGDNCLYIGDTLNGQGIIHKIKTRKVTSEGDTDDSSLYNALDLPFGFFPTDIESYGTDLIILAIQTTDSSANQGRTAIFLWDTVSDSFYAGPIFITDPLGTALLNVNGQIYMWSGTAQQGCRLSKYLGGVSIQDVLTIDDSCPPLCGAVIADGDRVYWGSFTVYPSAAAVVYSYGSKDGRITQALHTPIKATSSGANPYVTSLALYSQSGYSRTRLIVGWRDDSGKGIDKVSATATYGSVFRSQPFSIGKEFQINEIRIPLGASIASGMSVIPKIYTDDENSSVTLATINSTNFSTRKAVYKEIDLQNAKGENNFFLELTWNGTVELPVLFPIEIDIDIFENESNN